MMRKFSKKSAAALISAFFGGIGVVLACAGGWYSISESTNYTPEVFVDTAYTPFLYSWDEFYYTGYDQDYDSKFSEDVVKDWYNYLDKKVSEDEIKTVLFKTTSFSIDSLKSGKVPVMLAGTKLSTLSDKKAKEFINYILFAKKAEIFSLSENSDWRSKNFHVRVLGSMSNYIKSLDAAYKNCKDDFIKQRFLFQLVRAYYFNEDNTTGVTLFEKESISAKKNSTYYRTLSYAAGSIKKSKNIPKANYYYSLVYNGSDLLKTAAHFSFRPQNETDFQQTLAMCKNNDEKCTLWQMLGVFYKDEVRSIKEIVKIDPKSDKLDLLLSRAVNKIELNLFDEGAITAYESGDMASKKNTELQGVIKELLQQGQISKPVQWYTALGYLQTLDKKYAEAEQTFSLAKKTKSVGKDALAEIRLFEMINLIGRLKKIDSKAENTLLIEFTWLEDIMKENSGVKIRTQNVASWIHKIMAKKYRDQGDLQKAEFFQEKEEFYAVPNQLHEMQNFLLKQNKTPYEQYCAKIYRYKIGDLYEYEAINIALNDNIDQAIALMEKAGENGSQQLSSNPFNGGIKDCHDCDHALPQKNPYTKISTLKKMKEMKDKLASDTYSNALLLGNAYYNMNYYGSSRKFYYNAVSGYDQMDMNLPIKYYTMALGAAKTDEQKAKCTYMLAKCERNVWYNTNKDGDYYKKAFIAFKNFAELKKYSTTKYYQEVIKECGYFKSYAGK
jgi:hypothetical protein